MHDLAAVFTIVQVFFAIVIGLYFWNLLRNQKSSRAAVNRDSQKEMEKLRAMRSLSLTEPLSERTRPHCFSEIVGQEEGLRALKAALCGANPQHILVYGPPGVGKTAAARLVLEEAKRNNHSPFAPDACFVELDATIARFDERGIADPLIGSVHDPIYQGAGAMGMAGIPQPKPGAVTKAHGGVLFIDEIGELHPIQMNKLLKVLEDRKVFLESAYYSTEDGNIPRHIHDIFSNGLPADFRLIGATTRTPDQIPPAIRSRCVEVYFRSLLPQEVGAIARNAAAKIKVPMDDGAVDTISRYATNGREAVNIVQVAAGIIANEGREKITAAEIEWVVNSSQLPPRPVPRLPAAPQVGVVNGLAVYGPNQGTLLEIEATAVPAPAGQGQLVVTGIVEEEELGSGSRTVKRKGMARGSVENVLTLIQNHLEHNPRDYHIHINFPGGTPVDGPSAGLAIAVAINSAITGRRVDHLAAMTGEVSIMGRIKPVGGIVPKVEAARQVGVKRVFIPRDNDLNLFATFTGIKIIAVDTLAQVLDRVYLRENATVRRGSIVSASGRTSQVLRGREE